MNLMGMPKERDPDDTCPDKAETISVSSLSLIKMLKHGREGVPNEVMGLMLGEFVDDYSVRVDDVFAMPQIGTGSSVEAVDDVFQSDMLEMVHRTGRKESMVGWYHSHPGFGPWLSGTDMKTHQGFEMDNKRCVAVVIDPIQSVRGKVVIDAFRLMDQRQSSSNLGNLEKPSAVAVHHYCGKLYYNLSIGYRRNLLEEQMLINLRTKEWSAGFKLKGFSELSKENEATLRTEKELADLFTARVNEENTAAEADAARTRGYAVLSSSSSVGEEHRAAKKAIARVGKVDPKKRLENVIQKSIETNLSQILGIALSTAAF